MPRFLSDEWVAAFDGAVTDVAVPAVSADDGLALRHGEFATALLAATETGETVAVTVVVADGRLTMSTGARADAGAAVRLSWSDARAFLAGAWDPTTALATGRAQVRGDIAVLRATGLALEAVRPHLGALGEESEY